MSSAKSMDIPMAPRRVSSAIRPVLPAERGRIVNLKYKRVVIEDRERRLSDLEISIAQKRAYRKMGLRIDLYIMPDNAMLNMVMLSGAVIQQSVGKILHESACRRVQRNYNIMPKSIGAYTTIRSKANAQ